MSTGRRLPNDHLATMLGEQYMSDRALTEAQAILAESEPDRPRTVAYGLERVQGAGRADGRGRVRRAAGLVALAESLAAFVGE